MEEIEYESYVRKCFALFQSPRSCLHHLKNDATRSGVYRIHGNDGQSYQVYCDLTSEPGSAWTLVMSYTLKNVALAPFRTSVLSTNSPLNAEWPKWDAYRLALTQMEQLRSVFKPLAIHMQLSHRTIPVPRLCAGIVRRF